MDDDWTEWGSGASSPVLTYSTLAAAPAQGGTYGANTYMSDGTGSVEVTYRWDHGETQWDHLGNHYFGSDMETLYFSWYQKKGTQTQYANGYQGMYLLKGDESFIRIRFYGENLEVQSKYTATGGVATSYFNVRTEDGGRWWMYDWHRFEAKVYGLYDGRTYISIARTSTYTGQTHT